MMTFEDFKQHLKDNIKNFLPDEYKEAEITFQKVKKNNDLELDSIVIRRPDDKVIPNLYIKDMYKDYQEGSKLSSIMESLAESYLKGISQGIKVEAFNSDQMKENVVIQLVNRDMNADLLKEIPHKIQNDLAVVFRWVVNKDFNVGIGSVLIKNTMLEQMGITEDELYEKAKENTLRLFPPKICSMKEVLMGMADGYVPIEDFHVDELNSDLPMYVISNESGINGAAAILYPDVMSEVAAKLGGNVYLLPSSIHETIAVPVNIGLTVRDLERMVQDVNQDVVSENEVLSNHVYLFDNESKSITNASEKLREENREFVAKFLKKEDLETEEEPDLEFEP